MKRLSLILIAVMMLTACKTDEERIQEYIDYRNSYIDYDLEAKGNMKLFEEEFGYTISNFDGTFNEDRLQEIYDSDKWYDLYIETLSRMQLRDFVDEESRKLYPKLPEEWRRQHPLPN